MERTYPTVIRSTGGGSSLAVGRIGSIVGPLLAGLMLLTGSGPQQVFVTGAVPACCATIAIILNGRLRISASAYGTDSDGSLVAKRIARPPERRTFRATETALSLQ
jgi:MFS family permease